MFPIKGRSNHGYNTRSSTINRSQNVLGELIQEKDWQGVSQRVRSHPYDVLIRDCDGLNSLHTAVQSFHTTMTTSALLSNTIAGRSHGDSIYLSDRPTSSYSSNSTSIPLPTLTILLSSPFSPKGLIYQPSPLMNLTMNASSTDESSSSSEAGATPLHLACRNTNTPDAIILAIARANPLALNLQDDDGDTPIHLVLRYGFSEDVQQTLIELAYHQAVLRLSADDDIDDDEEGVAFAKSDYEDGDLPLHVAISHDASIDTIQLLVDAYPQGMFAKNHMQQTPLIVACSCGRYDLVEKVILESDVVLGCVRDLLEMGGDESDSGVGRPVFCLWEKVFAVIDEGGSANVDVEALEAISTLLTAATSDIASVCGIVTHEINKTDTHYKKVNRYKTISGKYTLTYSFTEAYRLLLASISVGEGIVPPEFVSFLIQTHPGIARKAEPSSGRMPLHIAVMQPHSRNLTPLTHPADTAVSRYGNPTSSSTSKCIKAVTSISLNGDYSSINKSHSMLRVILNAYPMATNQRDHNGCLPFHLAIKAGMAWDDGMKDVFMVAPEALRVLEPNTGLYPFMLAASINSAPPIDISNARTSNNMETNNSLDEVFSLLRCAPDLVALSYHRETYSGIKKKRSRDSSIKKRVHAFVSEDAGTMSTAGGHLINLKASAAEDFLCTSKRHKCPVL